MTAQTIFLIGMLLLAAGSLYGMVDCVRRGFLWTAFALFLTAGTAITGAARVTLVDDATWNATHPKPPTEAPARP